MSRVIVTGAAGFIGANVARRLVEDGFEVYLFTLPTSARWRLDELEEHAQVIEVDLVDDDSVMHEVRRIGPRWVLHLAAHGGYSWQTDAGAILRANVIGTSNLLAASLATAVETFVNTGSSSEYGLKDHAPAEDEAIDPNSVYAVAKAGATMLCRQAAVSHGLNACTLRLYSTYGPWEEPKRLVPALVVEGLDGRLPPLVAPDIARDFVWVGDVVDAYLRAARTVHDEPGAVFNVGTGVQTTIRQAVEVTRSVLALDVTPDWGSMPPRAWDTPSWVANARKIENALGWRSTVRFEEGFASFAAWFREHPSLLAFYHASRAPA